MTEMSKVVLTETIVSQVLTKFPDLHDSRMFITVFTTAHHWLLSWDSHISPISGTQFHYGQFQY